MKTKKVYLELLRILAIFLVFYVHTGIEAAERYTVTTNPFSYGLSLVMYSLAQISIPLFFMITGAVLLQKDETLRDVLCHRALRVLVLILLFGFVQYTYFYYLNPAIGFSIPVYLKTVYTTTIITQYWYLYTYLGLMLVLPLVRILAQNLSSIHFQYLFLLFFIMQGLLPIWEYLWGNGRIALSVPLFASALLYPLLGYYVEHKSEDLFFQKNVLIILNVLGVLALITNTTVAFMAHRQRGGAETLEGMTALLAIVLFIDIRSLFHKHPCSKGFQKTICFFGAGTFGVYLLEPPLRDSFQFVYNALEPSISWFPACIVWGICSIIFGCTLFHLLKKVPLLKKIL